MKIISNNSEFLNDEICGGISPRFINSKIMYDEKNKNNLIFCEEGIVLNNTSITFVGGGNLVYLSSNYHAYSLNLRMYTNSVFFMDENNYMNGILNVLVQEHQNVVIGGDGAFSYGIHIMTSDAHCIYDVETHERLNESKSIWIGDHVWLGQYASIFKGTEIASGSVIGGTATITNKRIPANTIWAGNPAKQIKKNIFWEKECPNLWDISKTEMENEYKKNNSYIFKEVKEESLNIKELDAKLIEYQWDISKKIKIIEMIRACKQKNRFFM